MTNLDNDTQSQCEKCGAYAHNTSQHKGNKCTTCEGYGRVTRVAPAGLERYTPYGFDKPVDCPDCNGTGQIIQ